MMAGIIHGVARTRHALAAVFTAVALLLAPPRRPPTPSA